MMLRRKEILVLIMIIIFKGYEPMRGALIGRQYIVTPILSVEEIKLKAGPAPRAKK